MEIFISAVLGELTTRSINFFIGKISKLSALEVEDRLHRVLLRADVIVDEAKGRRITNQAMLQQLQMLRDVMHRGCYMLETFRYQSQDKEDSEEQVVSRPLSLSKVNSLKVSCSFNKNSQILEQLQHVLEDLSSMILDVDELVKFLTSCPRLYSEPYSMHLQLANSMFGRQVEAEFVVNFLLHAQPHGAEELEVLPIVGPGRVGKSTLVAHVCKDERVCAYFSEILFLCDHDFTDDELATFRDVCARKVQNCVPSSNKDERFLVVIELVGDINEHAWSKFYSSSKQWVPRGTKIIVTSRSDKIIKFGTTQALTLKYLCHEAYWYFFKTLTFGSTDLKTQPRFAHMAMEIARLLNGSLICANATARVLRANFDIHFWYKVVAFLRVLIQKQVAKSGEHPIDLLNHSRPAILGRMDTPSEELVVSRHYKYSSQEEVPKVRMLDVVYGTVKPHGKFEVISWRSRIPPYHSYVYTCEIREPKMAAAKRKRSMKNGFTPC